MSVLGGGFNGSTQHLPILADEAGCDAVTLKVGRPRVPTSGGKTSVVNQKHTIAVKRTVAAVGQNLILAQWA